MLVKSAILLKNVKKIREFKTKHIFPVKLTQECFYFLTLISRNSFLQGWLIKLAAYFSMASKALAAFKAEKSAIHPALSNKMTLVKALQNFLSCGTKQRY